MGRRFLNFQRKIITKSLLDSLKTVLILKTVPKAESEFLFLLSLAAIGQFSSVYEYMS